MLFCVTRSFNKSCAPLWKITSQMTMSLGQSALVPVTFLVVLGINVCIWLLSSSVEVPVHWHIEMPPSYLSSLCSPHYTDFFFLYQMSYYLSISLWDSKDELQHCCYNKGTLGPIGCRVIWYTETPEMVLLLCRYVIFGNMINFVVSQFVHL